MKDFESWLHARAMQAHFAVELLFATPHEAKWRFASLGVWEWKQKAKRERKVERDVSVVCKQPEGIDVSGPFPPRDGYCNGCRGSHSEMLHVRVGGPLFRLCPSCCSALVLRLRNFSKDSNA